ncbi:MAG: hypothetical protein RL521_1219, partial [Bacteroidota bacterium]
MFSLLMSMAASAQVVINEVDADQTGTDATEFIELKGAPGASLNGHVLVMFNGSGNTSYNAIDLTGSTIPASGYFVIGNAAVPNVNIVINGNSLQNGADGVAIYQAAVAAWPNGTAVSANGLVDAVVYGTDDADATTLLATLTPGQPQVNEGAATATVNNASARIPDGGAPFASSTYV